MQNETINNDLLKEVKDYLQKIKNNGIKVFGNYKYIADELKTDEEETLNILEYLFFQGKLMKDIFVYDDEGETVWGHHHLSLKNMKNMPEDLALKVVNREETGYCYDEIYVEASVVK